MANSQLDSGWAPTRTAVVVVVVMEHQPVLLTEAMDGLAIKENGHYIDATFGRGGHSAVILSGLSKHGRLLSFDKDSEAVAVAQNRFGHDQRFDIRHDSFAALARVTAELGWVGKVDGILIDLGVSSPQLDSPERGFSFLKEGPLDMRMDQRQPQSAADWVATTPTAEMVTVFKNYGEERFAKRIATAIDKARQVQAITTTKQLAEIVAAAHPAWEKHKHPATRVFQAIRIAVNKELEEVHSVLQQALDVLAIGGRLVVISFHSLEDRIVKQFIKGPGDTLPAKLPVKAQASKHPLKAMGRAIRASEQELKNNPRARSAVLRIAEKVA